MIFTDAQIAAAHAETERLQRELDIANPDHIALWLEANLPDASLGYIACRIVEAHEAALSAQQAAGEAVDARHIAAANNPDLWSDDEVTAHRAASPFKVSYAREQSIATARAVLDRTAALSGRAAVAELVELLQSRMDALRTGTIEDEMAVDERIRDVLSRHQAGLGKGVDRG